jgi:hypothetical protein
MRKMMFIIPLLLAVAGEAGAVLVKNTLDPSGRERTEITCENRDSALVVLNIESPEDGGPTTIQCEAEADEDTTPLLVGEDPDFLGEEEEFDEQSREAMEEFLERAVEMDERRDREYGEQFSEETIEFGERFGEVEEDAGTAGEFEEDI